MDALRRDDLDTSRRTPPGVRARQALDLMQTGFRLKRAALRARFPGDSDERIEERFRSWLESDDRS